MADVWNRAQLQGPLRSCPLGSSASACLLSPSLFQNLALYARLLQIGRCGCLHSLGARRCFRCERSGAGQDCGDGLGHLVELTAQRARPANDTRHSFTSSRRENPSSPKLNSEFSTATGGAGLNNLWLVVSWLCIRARRGALWAPCRTARTLIGL